MGHRRSAGYEGMVAKNPRATYRPGPTREWMKVKLRREGVFPIGGIAATSSGFAGVLVGQREGGALHYLGTVEIGYNRESVAVLMDRAAPLTRSSSPFLDFPSRRGVMWLAPKLRAPKSPTPKSSRAGSGRPCGEGSLLEDVIRAQQQRRRDGEAERLCGLHVNHQLEFRGLLDREIGRLRALENLVHVIGGTPKQVQKVRPVGHQTSRFHRLAEAM
jgi:hypothetical protein